MMKSSGKLGDYVLGKKLGFGRFSKVREAMKDGKKYAIKYIYEVPDPKINQKLLELSSNEAIAIKKLEHPNIVKLYEYNDKGIIEKSNGKKKPVVYLVLELVTGGSLFDYIANGGRFSEKLARHYFRELIDAVQFLHSKGYAHSDIKIDNVLLNENYKIKLLDFGFSCESTEELHGYRGTLGYMAPEIIARKSYTGKTADLFAIGVLLYIMVTKHPPFKKAVLHEGRYMLLCKDNKLFWEREASINLSSDLKDLINALLNYDPKLRPTIDEIRNCKWFNDSVPTEEEVKKELESRRRLLNWEDSPRTITEYETTTFDLIKSCEIPGNEFV